MLYLFLKHVHSGIRWLLLLFLILSVLNAFYKWLKRSGFKSTDQFISKLTVYLAHLQFLTGLILFFISPKVIFHAESMQSPILRFFLVEHSTIMLISVVLITIGYSLSKKIEEPAIKFRRLFIYHFISLILIFYSIPWPWKGFGNGWF